MIFLYRNIEGIDIGIKIDECIYSYRMDVSKAIFCTYKICTEKEYLQAINRILILSETTAVCGVDDSKFCYICDCRSPNWVYFLVAFLEKCYEKIIPGTIFHGACLKIYNKGLIVLGKSKAGKSTLTHFLVFAKNAKYIDDDVTYFDGKKTIGFCSPICLRHKNGDDNYLLETNYFIDDLTRYTYDVPQENKCMLLERVNLILFPQYNKEESFQVIELSKQELINCLMTNIKAATDMRTTFLNVTSLTENVSAFKIVYNSCESVAKFLESFLKVDPKCDDNFDNKKLIEVRNNSFQSKEIN